MTILAELRAPLVLMSGRDTALRHLSRRRTVQARASTRRRAEPQPPRRNASSNHPPCARAGQVISIPEATARSVTLARSRSPAGVHRLGDRPRRRLGIEQEPPEFLRIGLRHADRGDRSIDEPDGEASMIAGDDDRPLRRGELVVLHVPAHAQDGAKGVLLARSDPEEESRDLRNTGVHEMPGKLRSARHAEPMVVRLTEAAPLTEHAFIFVPCRGASKPDRGRSSPRTGERFDGVAHGAYTRSRRGEGGNGCRRI